MTVKTPDEIPQDASMWVCWRKKSASVTKKVILYAVYCIVGITAAIVACFGLFALWQVSSPLLLEIVTGIALVINAIEITIGSSLSYIEALPLWITCGTGILLTVAITISVYAWAWCVARKLTEEDWESDQANGFAAFCLIFLGLLLAPILFLILTSAPILFLILALALILFLILALAFLTVDPVDKITIWHYIFRFFWAYSHYRKRIESKKE